MSSYKENIKALAKGKQRIKEQFTTKVSWVGWCYSIPPSFGGDPVQTHQAYAPYADPCGGLSGRATHGRATAAEAPWRLQTLIFLD